MKKFILSILIVVFSISSMFAQNATIRLEMPATMPNMGEDFFVEVWLDVLEHPSITPDIFTGQLGVNFDAAVLTPLKTAGPIPLQRYYWNKSQMFTDYGASLLEALAGPGDYRLVINYGSVPGMDPSFYGDEPFHMFDLKYTYNTADPINIEWGKFPSYDKINDEPIGGKLGSIESFLTSSDGAAYAMTYFDIIGNTTTAGLWTGATSSDWFDATNWDDGAVPTGVTDVTIPTGTLNDPVIETDGTLLEVAAANSIVNDASLTINAFGFLTVATTLTNNGSVMMLTNATDQASLICPAFAGAGSYTYDRYLGVNTALPLAERGWHYISSPVPGFTAGGNMNDYYLNTWDETISMWEAQTGNQAPDCTPVALTNNGTDGWSTKFVEDYATFTCAGVNPGTGMNVEFMGAPNAGTQVKGMTYTGAGVLPGFNLVGNPYPSYWYYDGFFFGGNWPLGLFDAIYYWDEDANQYASYVNGLGTNGGGPYVPPAQAFFLEMDGTQPTADIQFDDVDRAHVYGLPFYKDEVTDLVKLMASANGFTDETVIRFGEDFTSARDKSDARKLMSGGSTVPSLYTMASDIAISINGMPATESVPVYFECGTSGSYTIETVETSDFSFIELEDLLLGTKTNLLEGSYTFEHTTGVAADRFVLHFAPVGVEEMNANNVNIWSNENRIYVQAPASLNGDIVVYNIMGQEVVRTDIAPGVNVIPMDDVNTFYVVKVLTDDNAVTGKVYIK